MNVEILLYGLTIWSCLGLLAVVFMGTLRVENYLGFSGYFMSFLKIIPFGLFVITFALVCVLLRFIFTYVRSR